MEIKEYRFDGDKECDIQKMPTNSKMDKSRREEIVRKTNENQMKIDALQDRLYADSKESLVIIIQALDAAGKDSTIKHVMSGINPQGIDVYSFKQPTSEELAHDFLWRANKAMPRRGKMAIFNRSYYEDVLVVKVHELQKTYQMAERCLKKDFFEKRYKHIRHYEEYLYDNSYRIVKIFLNVSSEEQKKRFLERIEIPEKNWKFSESDLKERALWDDYMEAFNTAITKTATKEAPWYVIPADQKWYTRYLVSEIMLDALKKINPQYPEVSEEMREAMREAKKQLKQ